ncbi:uncharacterized protein EV420DRAFT_1743946 [Desarmillaria tabescens]|uniref:Uncharacterized protein n=1 Tax=Armillaria tabescens TaxID=1929756 RepID=A0AA39NI83_ARMTA|nr:uncharacterized protein EV420DRAFT_1743946 [Desarmillaria tabescens]KAK0466104.1 hypothetical protein EV420DRAFT_1743946 [Desarmillaria tabescens]
MTMGHTPDFENIKSRCGGKIIIITLAFHTRMAVLLRLCGLIIHSTRNQLIRRMILIKVD